MTASTAQEPKGVSPIALRQGIQLFVFGFLGLAYEILASKVFFLYYTESSQALSLVLSAFLVGLAVGSLVYARYTKLVSRPRNFVIAQAVLATYLCLALLHINSLISLIGDTISHTEVINQVLVGVIILLPPAVLLGTVFPFLLTTIVGGSTKSHQAIGRSNATDLAGAVTGGLVAGFVFIPLLGIEQSILVTYVLHLLVLVLFMRRRILHYLVAALFLMAFVYASNVNAPLQDIIDKDGIIQADPQHARKILYHEESPFHSVTVTREVQNNEELLRLVLGKRQQCDTRSFAEHNVSEIHFVERALEQIGGDAKAANIGLGCGLTAGKLADSDKVRSLDIIEINPKVPQATRFFANYNNNVLNNAKTHLIIKDGYAQMRDADTKYDLIAMDVEEPTVLHSSRLYSVENFQHTAERLNERGVFALWAFNNFDPDFTKIIHNSLSQAFKYIYVVQSGAYNDMYFLAAQHPLDKELLHQSQADLDLEAAIADNDSTEIQTLNHNALSRFWRQLSPDVPPKR